jgi:hypothetical protein
MVTTKVTKITKEKFKFKIRISKCPRFVSFVRFVVR